jgi:hypothetical protein
LTRALSCSSQEVDKDTYNREARKVMETDTLDYELNHLIDKNEILDNRELSFYNKNTRWRNGTIHLKNNDSVSGIIKNQIDYGGAETSMVLYFKHDDESKSIRYRADKIIGYESDGRIYLSERFSDLPPGFIEILEKGKINLFFTKYVDIGYTLANIYVPPVEEFYIETIDSYNKELIGPIPSSEKQFIEFMSTYLVGYPELILKINDHKYTYKQLREIIQIYNKHMH